MGWGTDLGIGGWEEKMFDAGMDYFGRKKQNQANSAQALRSMQYGQIMSGTAYQRAMADMRKAGLNPILAGKFGGASTPQGAMAQMQSPISSAITTKMASQTTSSSTALTDAKKIQQEIDNTLKGDLLPGSEKSKILEQQILKALKLSIEIAESGMEKAPGILEQMHENIFGAIKKASRTNPQFANNVMRKAKGKQQALLKQFLNPPTKKEPK